MPLADVVTARRKRASGKPVSGLDERDATTALDAAEAKHPESPLPPKGSAVEWPILALTSNYINDIIFK